MRFFSRKTRRNNRISIIRALILKAKLFGVSAVPTSSAIASLPHRPVAITGLVLAVCVGLAVGAQSVFSQLEDRDRALGVVDTVNVYPGSVESSDWSGAEQLLMPDLDEDALYQDFDVHNSAFISTAVEEDVAPDPVTTPFDSEHDDAVDGSVLPSEPEEPMNSPDGTDASSTPSEGPEQIQPQETDAVEDAAEQNEEGSPLPETVEEEQTEPQQEVQEPEPEEDPQPSDSASEPVVIKRATESFFTFLGTVTELLPFMNTSNVVSVEQESVASTDEPVQEEVSDQQPIEESFAEPAVDPAASEFDTQVEEQDTDVVDTPISTPAYDASTDTSETDNVASVTSTSPAQEDLVAAEVPVMDLDPSYTERSMVLRDFSTPALQPGQFVTGVQLRMSVGAQYESSASGTIPVIDIIYRNGSTTQSVGSILVEDEISNALNGGYFLFALPTITNMDELDGIEIEVVFKGATEGLDGMFVDAAWIEIDVEHLDKELLYQRLLRDILRRFGEPSIYTVLSEEKDFTAEELPHFNLKYNSQRNIAIRFLRDLFGRKLVEVEDITFNHKDVGDVGIHPDVTITDDGLMNIRLEDEDKYRLRPGEYELEITFNEGGSLFTDTLMFQWGLLSINPDKTVYELGETATISMGALSPNGNTICDADLSLYIIDPNDVLYKTPVAASGECNGNNVTDVPDYTSTFAPSIVGEYEMYLERIDTEGFIVAHTIDTFMVEEVTPFSLSRNGPSRIYPKTEYPMEITLTAKEDWEGALIEVVPSSFTLGTTTATVSASGDTFELAWEVSLKAGESQTFSYMFDAPDISPYLYTVGAARLEGELPVLEVPQTVIELPSSATATPSSTNADLLPEETSMDQQEVETNEGPATDVQQPPIVPLVDTAGPDPVPASNSEDLPVEQPLPEEMPQESNEQTPPTVIEAIEPMEQVVGTTYSQVLFEEHREWQIASDATGSLIVFWNSAAAIPSGWTCLSCGSGTFYQRFPRGGTTYNTTGGAATHTHTASAVVNTSATVNTENNGSGEISVPTHTHTYNPTISTVSSLPAYRQFRVIQSNSAGDPASIPAGAVMMFDDPTLPSGWTRLAALDGRYPRGENSIANGGSNTHTHTITGNTSAATNLTTLNSRTGGTQVTGAADNHAHSVSSNTLSESLEPPFIEVIFATAGSATSTPTGAIAMWSDEPPAQWIDRSSNPADPFYERFFKGASTYGTTGGALDHTPADRIGITSGAASVTDNARTGASGNSNTHTHLIDVTGFSTASNLPPYLTVIIGKKLGPIPMYTQTKYQFFANEDSLTPTDAWPVGADALLENEPILPENMPIKNGEVVRLRMQLSVENSTSTVDSFKMQFATTTAACTDAAVWTDVGASTSSVAWRGYDNATPSDGATLPSAVFVDTDELGSYEESSPSAAMPNEVGIDETGEWDFVLQQNNAEANTTYCFRMVESDGTPLFAYTEYPSLVTNAAPDAPVLLKLFDNEKVADTTPAFEFTAGDPEGEGVTYQIQVDNDYAFTSTVVDANSETNSTQFENLSTPVDKDPFTNGETIRFNNTTAFSNGTTYYWRVRGKDPDGSNQWGTWSMVRSFTVDTAVSVSTWFQTTDEQFNTNTLESVLGTSDQAQLVVGSTTGTMWSDPISFAEGDMGTAWGQFSFTDTETSSDLRYTIQYLDGDTWTDIPDSALSGNTAGFDTSPVSLLGVDKTLYPEIRIEANFTNSGASPAVLDWTVSWDYLIETPTIATPFANEKVQSTTPVFQFAATDPQSDDLIYDIQWSTNFNFSGAVTRTSNTHAGFSNLDTGGDSSPFNSGETIQFQLQAGDALSNGTTYWWRVRARDPLGDNAYSFYTDPRSFTVDTTVGVATWFQTTQSQFDNNILSGALTSSGNLVTVATTSDDSMLVYAEGTVTTPRYREWNGSAWSAEASALNVDSAINWIVTKAGSTRNEYITGTLGTDSDINIQVFRNGAWGDLYEVTTSASNVNMRGFDIAYEQASGDALVVNCDGDEDPSYHIWDGDTWTSGGSVDLTSGNPCGWVRLISDPISDEIILIARGTVGSQYSAWVWDGSSWDDGVTWGSMTDENNEGIAAAYEASGNQAVVAVSNGGAASFTWRSWNGSSWSGTTNQTIGDDFEWGSMAVDVGTDNMAICYIDQDNDIGVVRWTGSAWTGQVELDTGGNANTERAVDCEFEVGGSRDGYIMVTYSDTTAVRYRAWNGGSWSAEATISTITDASTVQLRRTGANLLQVMAYDDVNDRYDYSGWNGSTWSTRQALETNGSIGATPYKEPFMMAPRNPSVSATVIGQPLIDFNDGSGPYFNSMSWNDSEPGNSSITYQIEYYDGDSWELVPDLLIPGNSSGNSTSPLDLSNMLPVSTYDQIRPVANLVCSGNDCPTLSDWTITWAEGINVSGTARAFDQTTNLTSGTVAIAINGVLQVGKTGTIAAGSWSIPNVNVGPGDVVTVFLSGASDSAEAVAVTVGDGVGDITGIDLYTQHLSIGSDDTAVVSNAQLALYDLTHNEDVFFDVDSNNDLLVCADIACSKAELIIKAGNTFRPGTGGNVTTYGFENNGTFEPSGNTIRVSGSWDNNAITNMATSTVIFTATTTVVIPQPWYNSSWLYRIPVSIQASALNADVSDFPVRVDLSDLGSSFFSNVTADGGDIRVTAGDMVTELPRELVSIDTGAQTGELYFRADNLSASTDTTFYIYYGNNAANDYALGATYGAQNVWSNGYEAVYHLHENPATAAPQYADSTGNSSATAVAMDASNQVIGVAGNGAEQDGTAESIQTNFSQNLLASTWSIFANADGIQGACDGLMFSRGGSVSGINLSACGATNEIGYHWNDSATTYNWAGGPVYPLNEWFMATLVVEPSQATVYAHTNSGVTSGTNVATHGTSNINNLDFGWDSYGAARSFDGTIDEARLSSVARSQDWLSAEYTSIAEPDSFYAIGAEEDYASSAGGTSLLMLEDADGVLDFYNLTFGETSGNATWDVYDTLDVNNVLTLAHGTMSKGVLETTIGGNLVIAPNGVWAGIGTTTFDGTGASTWSDASSGQNIGHVVVDGSPKVLTLGSNVRAQSMTIGSDDTFDLAPANYDITIYGDWNNMNMFNPRSGDVIFAASDSDNTITSGGKAFYNMLFNGSGAWSFTEPVLTVTNNLTISDGTVTMPTGTTTLSGSFNSTGGAFAHNNALVYFIGTGSRTITVDGDAFNNAFYNVRFTGGGSWSFLDSATTTNEFRMTQGTVTFPSETLTVGGDFIKTGGTFNHNNGEVVFLTADLYSIAAGGSPFHNVTIRMPGVTSSTWYSPSWDYRIPITIPASAIDADLDDFPVYVDLSGLGDDFFANVQSNGGDIRITNANGTSEMPREIISIDTASKSGGLYFKADSLSSSADTTFYIYYGNAGATAYTPSSTYGDQNVWSNGYEAVYHLGGTSDSSANGRNLTAVGSPVLVAGGYDFNGDSDFLEMPTDFGIFDGTDDFTLQIEFNADAVAPSTDYATSPVVLSLGGENNAFLTFGDGDPGDSLIFRYQGWITPVSVPSFSINTDYAVTVAYDASSGVTNMYRNGALIDTAAGSYAIGAGTYSSFIGGLSVAEPNRGFDGTIYDVKILSTSLSDAWVAAEYDNMNDPDAFYATSSVETLTNGRTFTDTNVTVLNDLVIQSGLISFPSGTFSIGGSFLNDGTIAHNDGTVLFNSSDTGETIDVGDSPLYNMTFNNASGGWTIVSNATTTNNTTLTAGSNFTLASGQRLAVQGVFTNALGGPATTWTGSTLSLENGNYSLNTKVNPGDMYDTLMVKQDTDVKMWNSSASTTIVHALGSLYSQDHAGVDGDLYIYGSYPRTSGTEYWSYATDFDGTNLSGGSERQVDVRFAEGASAAITGSVFDLSGTETATTTVSNQGNGTYTVSITGGTTTASYYSFEDLGTNGVSVLGGSHVDTLSHGAFLPSTAGGSGLRVSASTINANPELQVFDVRFDASLSYPWLSDWNYRKSHVIESATGAGSDYQVKMNVHYGSGTDSDDDVYLGGNGKSDFGDLRFTSDDGVTELPYWIESKTDGDTAVVWVRLSENISTSDATIYLYYGNANANSETNGDDTFVFFDDFSGPSLDTGKWQTYNIASHSQTGGILTATTTNQDPAKIIAYEGGSGETGNNLAFRARFRPRVGSGNDQRIGLSLKTGVTNGQGYNYLLHNFSSLTPRAFLDDLVAWGPTHSEPWTMGTWYTEEIYHNGTNVYGRFNDGTWYNWARTGRTGYFALNTGGLGGTVSNDWDFALIRKIAAAEPAHGSWGSQESVSSYLQYNVTQTGASSTSFWWFRDSYGDLDGEAHDNDTGNPGTIRWDDSSLVFSVSGTVYTDDGTTPLSGGTCNGVSTPIRIVVEGGASYDGSCSASDGSFSIPNVVAIGDPTLTVFLNDASGGEKAVTVTKTPTSDISDLDLYMNRVITRHEDPDPLSIEDMAVYDYTDDTDIAFVASVSTSTLDTLTTLADTELFVWPDTTFTPSGSITLQSGGSGQTYDGSLVIGAGAIFNAYASTTNSIGGSLVLKSSAVFDAASTTVQMTATTTGKTISSEAEDSIDLHDLRFTGVGGGWNIQGNLTASSDIQIATGTVTGTGNITLFDGSFFGDGLLSLGGGKTTIENSNTLGGTQGWTFFDLTLGNGIHVGTTTPASAATTTVGGVLTIDTGHYFDAGNSVLAFTGSGNVFIEDGTFIEGSGTVHYAGVTGSNVLPTSYYDLRVGATAGTVTFLATGLGIAVSNDLIIGGGAATTFDLNALDPELSVLGDVLILSNGVLQGSDVDSFTVGGSWDNDGVYASNGGTLHFQSIDAEDIFAGSSSFGTVVLQGTGSYTFAEHATSTGAFTIGSSTSGFTLANGMSLAVGGTFTNALGGSATTWTGSTLNLISGTNYQANAKTISDTYENVVVSGDTDVRLWNSDAAAFIVDAGSSVYSQDHTGVDGELHIFGDYPGNGSTDHWSYATDFDGVDLSGGSEREVDVRFDDGASMSLADGGLSVKGSSSGTTTVQSAGAATYNLVIGGTASTTWNHYSVMDAGPQGLSFDDTALVHDLSYGTITVSNNGDSALSVAGSVIDVNPAKTFTNNAFATTTGVSGFNVTAEGSSVSSWRFTNHSGAIAGEAYDNDPDGDPGYIVWDDSTASITISGNVYSDEGSTVSSVCDDTTHNIVVRVAGLTTYTASCEPTTGFFSASGIVFSPGDSIVAYIDAETQKGATVTKSPVSNINNMHIYENRVIVRHESTDPLTIADMAVWDSSDDADIPFTAINSSPDTLTLPSNMKLLVWNGKKFAPGGNMVISGGGGGAAHDGTLEVQMGGSLMFAGLQEHSIGGSFILGNGASFDAGLSTTTFTTTGASRTIDSNEEGFHVMVFDGSGSWNITDQTLSAHTIAQSNGNLTFPTGTTTLSGSLNATGGSFNINGSPLVFTATGGGNVIRTDGSDLASIAFEGVGGNWSMTDVNATTTSNVEIHAGVVSLPSGVFTVGGSFRNSGGSFTHNTSLLRMISAASSTLLASSSDLFALHFDGSGTLVMEDQSLTFLDDVLIHSGTVNFATGTVSVGGSFDASGGAFNHASGTVLFNSSDTGETVDPGNSSFYNAVFAGAGGGWTMTASATTTNNFTLSVGSSYTQQNGTTLTVGNVFANSLGGSATTWTGSTLRLIAGMPFSINTKLSGADAYDAIVVGADTDVRSWNSSASSITVDPTGSLYSQDHAASNGALNIYGDFHISTTTEYWSYATDFDGTPLTGLERAVTVSMAANATTTVDGGSLQMVGASGNVTTVQNQGSGNYAFIVNAGTFNGLYYAYRNLDANGLVLANTPVITSLSYGDLELAVDDGTLMTVSSSTIDANASKVITGVRFAAAIPLSGTNVALQGSTSNAWTFVSHTGNLSGENFDSDGIDACGSIRWNDSACLLTQQTHYRWRHDDGGLGAPNTEWFDIEWNSRQRVRLVNDDTSTYTDAVVKLTVPYDSDMQIDFSDLRFTDQTGTTLVPHFIERYSASTEADVWVQVPTLAAEDTTTLFMYYDNATASSASDSGATFIASDDFEDGDISEYSGDTSLFSVDGSFAYSGSYGLDVTGNESDRADDGIARSDMTVQQGQIIRYMQYVDTAAGSGDEVCTLFGVQSPITANNNYGVCIEQVSGTDRLSIARDIESTDVFGGSVSQLAFTPVAYTTGWYEVEIDWQTNDDIDVTLSKDGAVVATVSTNDGTYTSGGFGFTYWFQNGGWDNLTSRPRVDTEPTVFFGAKHADGGASWASSLDSSASYTPDDIARLRLAIENTGLEITDQTFDIEYAVKGTAPSCEAVGSSNYAQIPAQASCGTSPLCMADSAFMSDNADVADLLFGTEGEFTLGKAVEDPSSTAGSLDIAQDAYTELEYAIELTANASAPAYCLRVSDAGDDLDTYLSVAELEMRFDPTVTNVTINDGLDILLNPGSTTTVRVRATATDLNGFSDLLHATSTMYRSGVGAACTADNNNCYISAGAPQCTFTGCSGNSCTVSCAADVFYHADATDVTPYEGQEWLAYLEVSDQAGGMDLESAMSGVELLSLRALSVDNAIDYGALEVASTTGSYNPTTTIQNIGNNAIDIRVEGTDLTDGSSSVIPASEQIFATTTFNYSSCTTCETLSSTTAVALEVDLSKPTSVVSPVTDVVYWGIAIPFGVASNPHSGTNIFYAIGETP